MEINAMINRINALAKKKKTSGLTQEKQAEQKELYKNRLLYPSHIHRLS